MKLTKRKTVDWEAYFCELTKDLDNLAELEKYHTYMRHYIYADNWAFERKCLPIRMPGRTTGGVWIDDDNVITKVEVDLDGCVIGKYPDDVNEKLQKYIGEKIEIVKSTTENEDYGIYREYCDRKTNY